MTLCDRIALRGRPLPSNTALITVRLSKSQSGLIWTGLNHIVCSYGTRERTGEASTAYPFQIHPLRRNFDTGTFSPTMMNRTTALWAMLKPVISTGGTFNIDSFQLRAAAFSSRATLQIQRSVIKTQKLSKSSLERRKPDGIDPKSIKNLRLKISRLIKYLERQMKRAERRFVSERSRGEFKELSKEWRVHLRWMKYHLAYFKPFRPGGPGIRRMQRKRIDLLVAMARNAIQAKKRQNPDDKSLREIIRLFVHDCHRGRVGDRDFRYMLDNQESPVAQSELFEYVEPRLGRERGRMRKNHGKATMIAHRNAASKPKAKALIKELAKNFEDWPREVRREKLKALMDIVGISVRGLAEDTDISDSTIRYYLPPSPGAKRVEVPEQQISRRQGPIANAPAQIPNTPRQPIVQQKASASENKPKKKIQLPPRPDSSSRRTSVEPESPELAELLLEFLQRRGVRLEDFHLVLRQVPSLLRNSPPPLNQTLGAIPVGNDRSNFLDRIDYGGLDRDRFDVLATGMLNILLQLGGTMSLWERAIDKVRLMGEELLGEWKKAQQPSLPKGEPTRRPIQIAFAVPRWREEMRGIRQLPLRPRY